MRFSYIQVKPINRYIVCWDSSIGWFYPDVLIISCFYLCAIFLSKILVKEERVMSAWLIIVTGLIYAYISVEQGYRGNFAMSMVYAGYSFSNVGLYILATK
jgi:hypothetical protein